MTNRTQYILLTSGEYSDYRVSGLLEGPADPPIKTLTDRFLNEYAPLQSVVRQGFGGRPYSDQYRDWKAARQRLLSEGAPVDTRENYYDSESREGNNSFLMAWLVAVHGWREVPYTEVHEGEADEE